MARRKNYITPPVDATELQGVPIAETAPTDGQVLAYNQSTGEYEPADQSGGGGGGNGDANATYVVMSATGSLNNERVLTAGAGINRTDGGAGGAVTISVDNTQVPFLAGATFTGNVAFGAGLSGSLQRLTNGLPYLVGSAPITVSTSSNGQVTASMSSASVGGTGGTAVTYSAGVWTVSSSAPVISSLVGAGGVTVSNTGTRYTVSGSAPLVESIVGTGGIGVSNSGTRWTISGSSAPIQSIVGAGGTSVSNSGAAYTISSSAPAIESLAGGTGITVSNSGKAYTAAINNGVVATISGSTFTGAVLAGGGLSGSLQQTTAGLSYLVAQGALSITSQSNGQIILSASGGGGGGGSTTVTGSGGTRVTGDGSIGNPYVVSSSITRIFGAGGITVTHDSTTSSYTISGSAQVVQSITGSGGTSVSNNGGTWIISSSVASGAPANVTYLVLTASADLTNERVITAGPGISFADAGTNGGAFTISAAGGAQAVTTITGNYVIPTATTPFTYILVDTVNTLITATLPSPASSTGYPIYFKDIKGFASASSTSTFLIKRNGSERIDGQQSDYLFQSPWGSLGFICNGTDWFIF